MTDDLGLFRDTTDRSEPTPPTPGAPVAVGPGARSGSDAVDVLCLALSWLCWCWRSAACCSECAQLQAWRAVPDFVGPGGAEAVVQVEDGQSLTAIGATLVRRNVVASVRAFTRAAEADDPGRAVQPGFYQLRSECPDLLRWQDCKSHAARVGHLEIRGGEQLDNVDLPDGTTVPGLLTEISRASCAVIAGSEHVRAP